MGYVFFPVQMAATIDLFPTIAKLTGAAMPDNVTIDGIDMSPFLFGNSTVCPVCVMCVRVCVCVCVCVCV